MELGLKRNEVKLIKYDQRWEIEFKETQKLIIQNTYLSEDDIQHIGSTSIHGMIAKPVIDLLIGLNSLDSVDHSFFDQLQKAGFFRLKVQREQEIILAKFTDDYFEIKTHFIHLVEKNGKNWNDLIFFRNYLRDHADAQDTYSSLKQQYVEQKQTGISEYTTYKEQFVNQIVSKQYQNG